MAAIVEERPELAPAVRTLLGGLRGRIRSYVWIEGLATAAAWLGVAFWVSLAIDWFFEPPPPARGVVLALMAFGFVFVVVRLIARRAFVRLSDSSMATVLERRFPQLDDALLTAVLLTGRRADSGECNLQMLAQTCREASQRIDEVRLGEVFNPVPLRRSIGAALLLAVSIFVFVLASPGAFGIWAQRTLLFSNELWPRKTHLTVEQGLFKDGVAKVARGDDFLLVAKADTSWPVVPKVVHVRFRTSGRKDQRMNRQGEADRNRDPFQFYSYKIQGILTPVRFDLAGGDARVRDLRIEVVESPTVVEMALLCEYPRYMARPQRTLPVAGVMQIPLGTRVTVQARANKELVRVQVDTSAKVRSSPEVFEADDLAADRRGFRWTIPSLSEDTTVLMTLSDSDGITGREPVRLSLVAVGDEPPQLGVRLDGIGQAVTPQAVLPAVGQISDDWGIAGVRFETTVDRQEPSNLPISVLPAHTTEWKLDARLEVPDLGLVPGQKLLLCVKATDHYDLGEGPNVGASERWLLDVVTADRLRAMLEGRELVLRQRFEAIIEEVTETRDLLLRLDFRTANRNDTNREKDETQQVPAEDGSEPGDEPEDEPEPASPMRQLSLRSLRVERALTNTRKNTHETRGVADAFDDIRKQLINNRIDTEELKVRLADGIVAPLGGIAGELLPELERRLNRLQEKLDDQQLGPQRAQSARQQADDVLLAMQEVLNRMIELEDFNEALELLRTIIKLQDQLNEQTRQRHKQKLRELLED